MKGLADECMLTFIYFLYYDIFQRLCFVQFSKFFFFSIKVTWLYVYCFFHLNSSCRLDLELLVSSICYTGFSLQVNFYSVINELLH